MEEKILEDHFMEMNLLETAIWTDHGMKVAQEITTRDLMDPHQRCHIVPGSLLLLLLY